jgi:hypothetical protein
MKSNLKIFLRILANSFHKMNELAKDNNINTSLDPSKIISTIFNNIFSHLNSSKSGSLYKNTHGVSREKRNELFLQLSILLHLKYFSN